MINSKTKFVLLNYLLLSQKISCSNGQDVQCENAKEDSHELAFRNTVRDFAHNDYDSIDLHSSELSEYTGNKIKPIIFGNATHRAFVERTILNIYRSATATQNDFLQLAMTLPGFHISTEHTHYMKKIIAQKINNNEGTLTSPFALYVPGTRTLIIDTAQLSVSPEQDLLHEFLHVANHHMQLLYSDCVVDREVILVEPYYPVNKIEKIKFHELIHEGLLKVRSLHMDRNSKLAQYYRQQLQNYPYMDFQVILTTHEYQNLIQAGLKLEVGQVHNIDEHVKDLAVGDFMLRGVVANDTDKTVSLEITFLDPVLALCNQILRTMRRVNEAYPKNTRLLELEAYIHQFIPGHMLDQLFPGMCEYKESLVKKVLLILEKQQAKKVAELCSIDSHLESYFAVITNTTLESMFNQAEKLMTDGNRANVDHAISLFKNLVAKSYHPIECNVFLGDIYYDRGDYINACKHYNRAFKKNYDSTEARLYYGVSLYYTKSYKKAEKVLRSVIKDCEFMLSTKHHLSDGERGNWLDYYNSAQQFLEYVSPYTHPQASNLKH